MEGKTDAQFTAYLSPTHRHESALGQRLTVSLAKPGQILVYIYIESNELNFPNAHAAEDAKNIFLRCCKCKPKTPETGRFRVTDGDISAGLIEDDK